MCKNNLVHPVNHTRKKGQLYLQCWLSYYPSSVTVTLKIVTMLLQH